MYNPSHLYIATAWYFFWLHLDKPNSGNQTNKASHTISTKYYFIIYRFDAGLKSWITAAEMAATMYYIPPPCVISDYTISK